MKNARQVNRPAGHFSMLHSCSEMQAPLDGIVTQYCCMVGFFALSADEQRERVPSICSPVYASFNEGDGMYTRPLKILLGCLRDAQFIVTNHLGEAGFTFVSEHLNEALGDVMCPLYVKWHYEAGTFDTASLDEPIWNALRVVARDIWDKLDEPHRVPFEDWSDWVG